MTKVPQDDVAERWSSTFPASVTCTSLNLLFEPQGKRRTSCGDWLKGNQNRRLTATTTTIIIARGCTSACWTFFSELSLDLCFVFYGTLQFSGDRVFRVKQEMSSPVPVIL
ncbi:hypothetical protein RUM43_008202 [Polyplax serrata]|uniref:Uncharacterized protein n=1 Tax=Polyplax serrata TaxID=468196 RepID=A0AAN8P6Q4_POLSC